MRAIDIKMNQYKTTYTVISGLANQGYKISEPVHISFRDQQFLNEFLKDNVFSRKMKLYCDLIDESAEYKTQLEAIHEIPYDYKRYYNTFGPTLIKRLEYREAYMEREIQNLIKKTDMDSLINERFQAGAFYSNKQIKALLQELYDEHGINSHAKAKDVEKYIPGIKDRVITVEGKSIRGYNF